MPWKKARDPLYRGDASDGLAIPLPAAKLSIVAHVLYLEGAGRETPYQSTTESEAVATQFARRNGKVYRTMAKKAEQHKVVHLSRIELMQLLRGTGQGKAKWTSALEVMTARRYVEMWAEHLLDFTNVPSSDAKTVVAEIYEP
jgi:hypothetical protein